MSAKSGAFFTKSAASPGMALLQRLEARARDGDLPTCVSVFVEIEAEAERLMAALAVASTSGEVCAS